MRVLLNGAGDTNPPCRYHTDPMCEGPWYATATGNTVISRFNDYTMEVVQQIGSDSFAPGHGVLIGKHKTGSGDCGEYNCFSFYLDSNPEDINQVDYLKADGTPVKAVLGDERQLNDGSFNVGVNSGSEYERREPGNNLHFYILDKRTDAQGVLRYKVGVRSLGGSGPQTRGVALSNPVTGNDRGLRRPARSRSRTRASRRRRRTCTRRTRRRTSTATSTACRRRRAAPAGPLTCATCSPRRSSARASQVPVYIEKATGAAANGHRHADGDVGERPVQDAVRDLHDHRRQRRRHRPGHAGPDAGRAGAASARSRRARRRTTSPPRRRTSSRPPVTRR